MLRVCCSLSARGSCDLVSRRPSGEGWPGSLRSGRRSAGKSEGAGFPKDWHEVAFIGKAKEDGILASTKRPSLREAIEQRQLVPRERIRRVKAQTFSSQRA